MPGDVVDGIRPILRGTIIMEQAGQRIRIYGVGYAAVHCLGLFGTVITTTVVVMVVMDATRRG